MKQVKISDKFFEEAIKHNSNDELLYNEDGRPCVLIVKLKYKGRLHKFVVPMRSNISSKTPKSQFFSLPPNPSTRPYNSHGVHYIKLFPIVDKYILPYHISSNFDIKIKDILSDNESTIIKACQDYLHQCEIGNKHYMTPDIDKILTWLYD